MIINRNAKVGEAKVYESVREIRLEKENADLKVRLAHIESEYAKDHQLIIDWMDFENRSIEKNGEYVEDEINTLIKRARQRIKERKEFGV